MDGTTQFSEASLEQKITTRCGILLSQTQLAELLGRTPGGLRYSLSYPSDQHTHDLKASGRKIGRPGACWRTCSPGLTTGRCV